MIHQVQSGNVLDPVRITVGIVLMLLVSMWTFAAPASGGAGATTEAVIEVSAEF